MTPRAWQSAIVLAAVFWSCVAAAIAVAADVPVSRIAATAVQTVLVVAVVIFGIGIRADIRSRR